MKNVTVAIPDDVYRRARVRAAQEGTSLSALVANYLRALSSGPDEFDTLRQQQRAVQAEIGAFRGADRLPREESHDRALR